MRLCSGYEKADSTFVSRAAAFTASLHLQLSCGHSVRACIGNGSVCVRGTIEADSAFAGRAAAFAASGLIIFSVTECRDPAHLKHTRNLHPLPFPVDAQVLCIACNNQNNCCCRFGAIEDRIERRPCGKIIA